MGIVGAVCVGLLVVAVLSLAWFVASDDEDDDDEHSEGGF